MGINRVIRIIVLIQILAIIFIGLFIQKKRHNILGVTTEISPIKKETIVQNPTGELKGFYELSVGKTEIIKESWMEKEVINTHNLDGLNEDQEYKIQKDKGVFRIITLGDSFTYGYKVNTKDNWTEMLEEKLNENKICKNIDKFEVINLGVPGYDIQYEVERYKTKGKKYNPDLIIWMLVDLYRLNDEINKNISCPELENRNTASIKSCWEKAQVYLRNKYPADSIYDKQFSYINEFIENFKSPILFIDYFGTHQKIINKIDNKYISSSDLPPKIYTKTYSFGDSHPNELGYKMITDVIFKKLFELDKIKCEPLD